MDNYEQEEQLSKSKSQVKREMTARQKLGERLLELSEQQLNQLELPEQLVEAVLLAKRIKAHGGKYRQLQYIGKLMRSVDPEPIEAFFAKLDGKDYAETAQLHLLEAWRERLISDTGNAILTEYMQQFPQAESQRLRQLIQAAKKERESGKPPGAGRKLFQYLREIYQAD